MLAAPPRRFTVDEYHRLAEVGVLHEDDRVELLNGVIVDMMPIGPFHGGSVNRLNRMFERLGRDRWVTSIQNPVHIGRTYSCVLKRRSDHLGHQALRVRRLRLAEGGVRPADDLPFGHSLAGGLSCRP